MTILDDARAATLQLADEFAAKYVNRHAVGEASYGFMEGQLLDFAERIRADEREKCAAICEDLATNYTDDGARAGAFECAAAIRSQTAGSL